MPKRRPAGFIGKREAKRLNRLYSEARAAHRAAHPHGPVEVTEGVSAFDPKAWMKKKEPDHG